MYETYGTCLGCRLYRQRDLHGYCFECNQRMAGTAGDDDPMLTSLLPETIAAIDDITSSPDADPDPSFDGFDGGDSGGGGASGDF